MSWAIKVRQISHIIPIPKADKLELAIIGNWPCVVAKNEWKVGDYCIYCPQDSIIPLSILKDLGLENKLAGPNKDRVKAIKLRGQLSVGILIKPSSDMKLDDDVADKLGITKWEPPIPVNLAGKITTKPSSYIKYDIENYNNVPDWFSDGELVVCTTKIDGTNVSYGMIDDKFYVCSRNLCLDRDDANIYWIIANKYNIENKLRHYSSLYNNKGIWLHGEIFGKGIQSLHYGQKEPSLMLFDVRINRGSGFDFINYDNFVEVTNLLGLPIVPCLGYNIPFNKDSLNQLSGGLENISGQQLHINEGVIIRPITEQVIGKNYSRKIVKYINPEYLLRGD